MTGTNERGEMNDKISCVPVLDSTYLSRLGFSENRCDDCHRAKSIPQGWLWVDPESGLGRLELKDGQMLYVKFVTVTHIKWFLDCLR